MSQPMDRDYITRQIKLLGDRNGGRPPSAAQLKREAGIEDRHIRKHWTGLIAAQAEAGYAVSNVPRSIPSEKILSLVADLANELSRVPTSRELEIRRRVDSNFPSYTTIQKKYRSKEALRRALLEFTIGKSGFEKLIWNLNRDTASADLQGDPAKLDDAGFVYLREYRKRASSTAGRYKIGGTQDPIRRDKQLRSNAPDDSHVIYEIKTNHWRATEKYWLVRFGSKRVKSEFFDLSADDIAAFKRWHDP